MVKINLSEVIDMVTWERVLVSKPRLDSKIPKDIEMTGLAGVEKK